MITLVLVLQHSIQNHFSCWFYYTVIPPSCKMNDLSQFFFIVEQEQPETEAGKRHHIDLHVSSVLFHGT